VTTSRTRRLAGPAGQPESRGADRSPIRRVPSEGLPRLLSEEPGAVPRRSQNVPEATVARLPVYLRALSALQDRGVATVSSEELAAAAGVNSAKLRKDLSYLGSYGTRGVGYEVEYLVYQISRELGLTQDWPVAIIGVGNLGHALANYGGFSSRGFRIAALLDADPRLTGRQIAGLAVRHIDDLERVIVERQVSIAVLATPARAAQEICDRLVAAGVTSILNFAPAVVSVPEGVDVRKVDLAIELQILAFHEQRKAHAPSGGALDVLVRPAGHQSAEFIGPDADGLGDYPEVMPA
jgi:redox-sensing transcriptional repressor